MSSDIIRYIKPLLPTPEEWAPYLRESYASGYFSNFGPAVRHFERCLQDKYACGRAVVTAPNATNGLVTALQALGVKGKVLTPAYTFPATSHAILMAQCTPVFCDVSEETWELAPDAVEQALRDPEIVAVLHVRAYGFCHDLKWLEMLTRQRHIPLIVDAAAAIGSSASAQQYVGQQGDMEIFSFHATKVFGIGEGGATFSAPRHEQALREVSNFGIRYPDDVVAAGQNSKMSDFQAAVGLAVLDRIDEFVACRRRVAEHYRKALQNMEWVAWAPGADLSPWQSYPIRLAADHDVYKLVERAKSLGLELKHGYNRPLHCTGYLSRYNDKRLPVTEALAPKVVCLPVYSDMPLELAGRVLEILMAASR